MRGRQFFFGSIAFGVLTLAAAGARAGEYGQHYFSGSDGIKAGSLDEAGFHLNLRVLHNHAYRWYDEAGNRSYYKREIFYVEPELAWASPELWNHWRYEASIALPTAYHQEDMVVRKSNESRDHVTLEWGDLRATPIAFGREWERFDLSFGYTFFAPTGDFGIDEPGIPGVKAARPNSGKGYWTHMLNLGGAYYFDACRTWSASVMTHYEFHTRQKKTHIDWGDNFHFEAGIGKDFNSGLRLGAVGYGSWQTADTRVPGGGKDGAGNRIFAAGIEAGYFSKRANLPWFATVRSLHEFGAKGNLQDCWRGMLNCGIRF